jgi:hypothetical protein
LTGEADRQRPRLRILRVQALEYAIVEFSDILLGVGMKPSDVNE